jgi:predicted outer membrane protein
VKSFVVAGASILLFPLAAMAADSAISAQDKTFVQQAAIGGMAEVQEGQLATTQARDNGCGAYGRYRGAEEHRRHSL